MTTPNPFMSEQPGRPAPQEPPTPGHPYPGYPQSGHPYPGGSSGVPPQMPAAAYAAQTPPPRKRMNAGTRKALFFLAGFAVLGLLAAFGVFDKKEGESVQTTTPGTCISMTGSATNVKTEGISCDDTGPSSYIVAAKLADNEACKAGGYSLSVYEHGRGSSRDVLCLVPNYRVGTCYEETRFGPEIKTVDCTESSTVSAARYKITERADSKSVSDCADTEKQKVFAYDIQSDPARTVGFCAEILGADYTWE
ncbi:MAG: hypothetical protein QM809_12210 [Gordonia sp. (in: high G+C Gram-positive bacteria)]|uniref:LppU/SCO3897 family protein n=1 Tax=Gordonia sp. (in: high G+C Gram-positive bacteria) TaxID=84139 RepID=UPI0039E542CF